MPQQFKKGDIIFGRDRRPGAARHPIVYLEGDLSRDFIGVMLTHSNSERFTNNIFLPEEYIDDAQSTKDFQHENTHFVSVRLTKRTLWGPFRKVGEITVEGVKFIEENISRQEPIYWDEYLRQNRWE